MEQQASATAMCLCDVEQQMGFGNTMVAGGCRKMTERPSIVHSAAVTVPSRVVLHVCSMLIQCAYLCHVTKGVGDCGVAPRPNSYISLDFQVVHAYLDSGCVHTNPALIQNTA